MEYLRWQEMSTPCGQLEIMTDLLFWAQLLKTVRRGIFLYEWNILWNVANFSWMLAHQMMSDVFHGIITLCYVINYALSSALQAVGLGVNVFVLIAQLFKLEWVKCRRLHADVFTTDLYCQLVIP